MRNVAVVAYFSDVVRRSQIGGKCGQQPRHDARNNPEIRVFGSFISCVGVWG